MNPSTLEAAMYRDRAVARWTSVPLMLRRVPRNHVYGFALNWQKDWYAINAAGGKVLFWASLPLVALGIFLLAPAEWKTGWADLAYFLPVAAVIFFCARRARKADVASVTGGTNAQG